MRRMKEVDLTSESLKASLEYIKTKGGLGIPTKERTDMNNFVAHGFFMGYRKCEEDHGAHSRGK
jgi:hypothetical protein